MIGVYSVESIEIKDGKILSLISIDKNHKVFEGHFPERSILPGVIELEIIKSVLSLFLDKSLRLKIVKNAKYMALVLPDEVSQFMVEIEYKEIEEGIKVKSVIKDKKSVYLKFSGIFVENE